MDHFVPVSHLPSNGLERRCRFYSLPARHEQVSGGPGTSLAKSRGMNATPSISPAALANEAAQAHPTVPFDSVKQSTNTQGFAAAMNEASAKPGRKPVTTRSTDNGKAGGSLPVAGNHSPPAATPAQPSAAAAAAVAATQSNASAAGAATTPQSGGTSQSTVVTAAAPSQVPTPGSALASTPASAAPVDPQDGAPGTPGPSSSMEPGTSADASSAANTADAMDDDTADAVQSGGTSASAAATAAAATTPTIPSTSATSASSSTATANAALADATATVGAASDSAGTKATTSGTAPESAPAADSAAGLAAQLTDAAATTPAGSAADNANRAAATSANSTTSTSTTPPTLAAANAAAAAATTQAASGDSATFLGSFLAASYQPSAATASPETDPGAPDAGSPTVTGVSGAATSIVQSALTSAFVPAVAATLNSGVIDKRAGSDAGDAAPAAAGPSNDGSAGAAQLNSSATAAGSADPTPPVSVKVNAGVDTPEFSEGLADRVSWMVDSNLTSAKLQVNPPQLGPIEIRIAIQGDSAQVSLATHSGVTRDALEASAPKLREMLGQQGFGQVSVDISQRSFQDRSASSQPYDWTPSAGTKSSVAAVSPVSSPMSRISSSAVDAYA